MKAGTAKDRETDKGIKFGLAKAFSSTNPEFQCTVNSIKPDFDLGSIVCSTPYHQGVWEIFKKGAKVGVGEISKGIWGCQ